MTGYLGRVSAGHHVDAHPHPGRTPRGPVAGVVRAARTAAPARREEIPRQPIQAATGRVDKRPNGRTERVPDAHGKAVFRTRQAAAPVTRGKGHALVVSAVLSVGGDGQDRLGRPPGIALRRTGGRFRFRPRTLAHAHFVPSSCLFAPAPNLLRTLSHTSFASRSPPAHLPLTPHLRPTRASTVSGRRTRVPDRREAPSEYERLVGAGGIGTSPARFACVCHEHRECECARR